MLARAKRKVSSKQKAFSKKNMKQRERRLAAVFSGNKKGYISQVLNQPKCVQIDNHVIRDTTATPTHRRQYD